MQWQIEDAMTHAVEILDMLAAEKQAEVDAVTAAERRVAAALERERG